MKNPAKCLFSSGHVIVCDFFDFVYLFIINFFFLKLSSKMFPLNRPRYYGDWWGKQRRVRRHESRRAVPLRWFFWPIRSRDFKRFWKSFGKSAQGHSRSCCKLSPMKIPSSRLAAPGSPRMEFPERRILHSIKKHGHYFEKENWRKKSNRTGIRLASKEMFFTACFILNIAYAQKRSGEQIDDSI